MLLVDHNTAVRRSLARALQKHFDVVEAEDGRRALEMVAAGEPFDAMVTDLEMPDVDGRALIEALPIALASRTILVSGGAKDQALLAWAKSFPRKIEKPVSTRALVALLKAHIDPGRGGGSPP